MTTWLVILAVGAGSLVLRAGPLLALRSAQLSARADRTIRHAGLAAIAALTATAARHAADGPDMAPTLLALGAGGFLAYRKVSLLKIIAVGVGIYAGGTLVLNTFT